ncbi:MAG: hypothetical protein KDC83_00215 [Flavobacteriales bacterium]|nr:hypothetical protein [Flavobacteriales bacterium]
MIKRLVVLFLVTSVILSGCKTKEGVERSFVSKRKYSKGFYWQGFKGKNAKTNDVEARTQAPDPMKFNRAPMSKNDYSYTSSEFKTTPSNGSHGVSLREIVQANTTFESIASSKSQSTDRVLIPKIKVIETKTEGSHSFEDFITRFPLDYGMDRPEPLEKRGLQIDKNALNAYTYRSMLGTGIIGTSFVISATSLFSLLVLTGSMLSFLILGGRKGKEDDQKKLSSLSTAALILGSVVVISSGIAIVSSLLV